MSATRVLVVALGGTIAMTDTGRGVAPTLTADDLLAAVPGLSSLGVELTAITLRNTPSASLTLPDLLELHALIAARFAEGVDGAVVTQGTDTIEETAYVLDLLHDGPQPIVVTGAMRNPTLAGPDGPANLLAAVTVAAAVRDLGCLVVMADEIHAARHVRKTNTTSVTTFRSPNGGPLGHLVEGIPRILQRPTHRSVSVPPLPVAPPPTTPDPMPPSPTPDARPTSAGHAAPTTVGRRVPAALPRVGLYTATLGDDGTQLGAFAAGLDGLVVAAFGVGHVPSTWPGPLEEIAARIPVVLASRTGSGSALTSTYDYPGSEQDLLRRGLLTAGFLHPYKARLLLAILLASGAGRERIAAALTAEGDL